MRLTAEDYEGLLDNENVQRALHSIRETEGTNRRVDPYRVGFGFSTIDDLSQHPGTSRAFKETTGRSNRTTAAGAYQTLKGTWDEVSDRLGLKDFSPRSQDIAAVSLIDRAGALQNVLDGDVKGFTKKVGGTWASMPSSRYAQPKKSQAFVDKAWSSYAGKQPANVPAPRAAPYGAITSPDVIAASSVPAGLLGKQSRVTQAPAAARVAQSGLLASNVPTPTARPSLPTSEAQAKMPAPDVNRFGYRSSMAMPQEMANKIAASRGLLSGRVAPQGVPQAFGLSPVQETNLASRLGTFDAVQPSMAQYSRPSAPLAGLTQAQTANLADRLGTFTPTQPAARVGLGGLLGITPAAAASMPSARVAQPATSFAGTIGSPRALEGRLQQASLLGPASVPTPTSAPRPAPITATRTIGPAPTVAAPQSQPAAPQRTPIAQPTAAPARTAVAQPQSYAPTAPTIDDPTRRDEKIDPKSMQQRAAIAGTALLGSAVAGPVGGLIGGYVGNKLVDGGLLGSTRKPTTNSEGYATSLPSRPSAPSKAQRAALDRDLAATGRMGNGGPSISKEASRAIGAEKAAGKGPGGLW